MYGNLENTDTLGVGCDCASFSEAGGYGFLAEGGLGSVTQSSSKEEGRLYMHATLQSSVQVRQLRAYPTSQTPYKGGILTQAPGHYY